MKYYYNIDAIMIRQIDENYYVESNEYKYLFCECDIYNFEKIERYIYDNLNYHQLLLTSNGEKVVEYDHKIYALFKINITYRKITIDDLYDSMIDIKYEVLNIPLKWKQLWSKRIDYIEYQMDELNSKYSLLSKITHYYIGMAENAIQLLEKMNNCIVDNCITHRRIKYNMNTYELYNPTLCVIDSRVRDLAEYYKDKFFYTEISCNEILNDIYSNLSKMPQNETIMFFVRLLYPSYFFDLYDMIMMGLEVEKKLDIIMVKSMNYEKMLKTLLKEIKKTTYIDNIDWLN